MRIDIADIGDVIAFLLHPVGEREFPEQELARALRQWCVEDLAILAVGPVPAHAHVRSPVPNLLAVVVKRPLAGPAVVCRPGGIAALEEKVTGAVIADNKDDVALQLFTLRGELADVDAARPILRDRKAHARLPLAFAQALHADGRIRLRFTFERAQMQYVPAALALIVTEAVQIDHKRRRRVGAD